MKSNGNKNLNLILRGGENGPNYDKDNIKKTIKELVENNENPHVVIDLSHGNSQKNHKNQILVGENIAYQLKNGNKNIVGVMIESNINEGNQKFDPCKDDKKNLKYGVSITDSCINFEDSIQLLNKLDKCFY